MNLFSIKFLYFSCPQNVLEKLFPQNKKDKICFENMSKHKSLCIFLQNCFAIQCNVLLCEIVCVSVFFSWSVIKTFFFKIMFSKQVIWDKHILNFFFLILFCWCCESSTKHPYHQKSIKLTVFCWGLSFTEIFKNSRNLNSIFISLN